MAIIYLSASSSLKWSRICHPKIGFFGIKIILAWLFFKKKQTAGEALKIK